MEQFTHEQERAIRALAFEIAQEVHAGATRRGRPAGNATPAEHRWLPEGQLLASEADVMKALQIGETKLDDLESARLLVPVRIDTVRRYDPRDVEAFRDRLRDEHRVRTRDKR